jgi:hypothetical protein
MPEALKHSVQALHDPAFGLPNGPLWIRLTPPSGETLTRGVMAEKHPIHRRFWLSERFILPITI